MPTRDALLGKLEGLVEAMRGDIAEVKDTVEKRFSSMDAELNRRFEEEQRLLDERLKAQGERLGKIEERTFANYRRNGNGSADGTRVQRLMAHPATPYVMVGGGSAGLVQILRWLAAHLK